MRVLVTGGAGLVGSECCRHFAGRGHEVTSVDNYSRATFFGSEGDTSSTIAAVCRDHPGVEHHEADIRDVVRLRPLVRQADLVIHTAAQPSHSRSIEIPLEDFSVNAAGTLGLLELMRTERPGAVFIYCSTNKVYGDRPNSLPLVEKETRFDYDGLEGVDESMSLDQCLHTPFGVSKTAADLYVQEYGRLHGLKTGVFRMGCIAGGAAKATPAHNWEGYFMQVALAGTELTIHGYRGKQVRDVVHARDIARLFEMFAAAPRPGEVYNIGGGRANSISLLESFELIERISGRRIRSRLGPPREGDHIVYITDLGKVRRHYGWAPAVNLEDVFREIHGYLVRSFAAGR
ncbi:MAG: NAD-dependent epimerase/dehydratase family protein [Planctomycetes bacterium]|nr:NAD-dependent epimerase/dehydratase family protein [Planctomycetota bacterium]